MSNLAGIYMAIIIGYMILILIVRYQARVIESELEKEKDIKKIEKLKIQEKRVSNLIYIIIICAIISFFIIFKYV